MIEEDFKLKNSSKKRSLSIFKDSLFPCFWLKRKYLRRVNKLL